MPDRSIRNLPTSSSSKKLIDFSAIRKAKLKVAVELMYGTGRGYLDTLLEEAGAKVTVFHERARTRSSAVTIRNPMPRVWRRCPSLSAAGRAQIGLGLDGDADRFGIVDKDGTWLTPNQILALALYHLKKNRGWTGAVVRTVPTSHQVDAVAASLGVKVHETPVGFQIHRRADGKRTDHRRWRGIRRVEREGTRAGKGRNSRLPAHGGAGRHGTQKPRPDSARAGEEDAASSTPTASTLRFHPRKRGVA